MPRLFYALWPEPATRAALAAAAAAVDVRGARRVHPDNLHITVVFLGAVEDTLALPLADAAAPAGLAPFTLDIDQCGWWRASRVAWLAPRSVPDELIALQHALVAQAAQAGLVLEHGPFRPHLTIARQVRRAPRIDAAIRVAWQVTDFALVESRTDQAGAHYEVRRRWPLVGA